MSGRAIRIVLGLIGAALTIAFSISFYTSGQFERRDASYATAQQQLGSAQAVLSFLGGVRVENVRHFAGELSKIPEVKAMHGITPEILNRTSFGELPPGIVIVNRSGARVFANGPGPATGDIDLPEVAEVLGGRDIALLLVKPGDPTAAKLGASYKDLLGFATIAALRDGKDTLGAVIVVEPVGPEFFQNFGMLTSTRVSIVGAAENYGTAPLETEAVKSDRPELVETKSGLVWALRAPYRVPPTFTLGEVILAADGRHAVPKASASVARLVAIVVGVALMLAAAFKRT